MPYAPPPFPKGRPRQFRATVHGTVFGGRWELLEGISDGAGFRLVPDPPGESEPEVWVHLDSGDPIGHLPPEISAWLAPWMQRGGAADATAVRVRGDDVPSWRRVVLEVVCGPDDLSPSEGEGPSSLSRSSTQPGRPASPRPASRPHGTAPRTEP